MTILFDGAVLFVFNHIFGNSVQEATLARLKEGNIHLLFCSQFGHDVRVMPLVKIESWYSFPFSFNLSIFGCVQVRLHKQSSDIIQIPSLHLVDIYGRYFHFRLFVLLLLSIFLQVLPGRTLGKGSMRQLRLREHLLYLASRFIGFIEFCIAVQTFLRIDPLVQLKILFSHLLQFRLSNIEASIEMILLSRKEMFGISFREMGGDADHFGAGCCGFDAGCCWSCQHSLFTEPLF